MKIKTQHIEFLKEVAKAYLWEKLLTSHENTRFHKKKKLITTYTYTRKE